MEADHRYYEKIAALLTKKHEKLFEGREDAKTLARKKAQEDARFVLPNASATRMLVTMNARELQHFLSLRCCSRAQWEIRGMAVEMLRLCKQIAPVIFENAGPGCVGGPCPEGAKSCGKAAEMREMFKAL